MEAIKRAVRDGDLNGLSAARFLELGVEIDEASGADEYTCLHWACHYGKAEVGDEKQELSSLAI